MSETPTPTPESCSSSRFIRWRESFSGQLQPDYQQQELQISPEAGVFTKERFLKTYQEVATSPGLVRAALQMETINYWHHLDASEGEPIAGRTTLGADPYFPSQTNAKLHARALTDRRLGQRLKRLLLAEPHILTQSQLPDAANPFAAVMLRISPERAKKQVHPDLAEYGVNWKVDPKDKESFLNTVRQSRRLVQASSYRYTLMTYTAMMSEAVSPDSTQEIVELWSQALHLSYRPDEMTRADDAVWGVVGEEKPPVLLHPCIVNNGREVDQIHEDPIEFALVLLHELNHLKLIRVFEERGLSNEKAKADCNLYGIFMEGQAIAVETLVHQKLPNLDKDNWKVLTKNLRKSDLKPLQQLRQFVEKQLENLQQKPAVYGVMHENPQELIHQLQYLMAIPDSQMQVKEILSHYPGLKNIFNYSEGMRMALTLRRNGWKVDQIEELIDTVIAAFPEEGIDVFRTEFDLNPDSKYQQVKDQILRLKPR